MLHNKIITKSDGELYDEALEKALEDPECAFNSLYYKIVTKKDGEVYRKALEKALERALRTSELAFDTLYSEVITKSDGEIFEKVVDKVLENSSLIPSLFRYGVIKESDGKAFDKVIEKVLEDSKDAYDLIYSESIRKSSVSPETWEKLLASAEKYKADIRQKFAGRGYILWNLIEKVGASDKDDSHSAEGTLTRIEFATEWLEKTADRTKSVEPDLRILSAM